MLQPVNSASHSRLRCHLSAALLPGVLGNNSDEALIKRHSILSWPLVVDSSAQSTSSGGTNFCFQVPLPGQPTEANLVEAFMGCSHTRGCDFSCLI